MFSRLDQLEEMKTKGRVTHQCRESIIEARDTVREHVDFLKREFKDEINTIEGKRDGDAKIVKEIEKSTGKIATAKFGRPQALWVRKLRILREENERNQITPEKVELYEQSVAQAVVAEGIVDHMEELLKEHTDNFEHELKKAPHDNNVDIEAYHGGSIVGNHCMNMASNDNKIMDTTTKAMLPKINDGANRKYLQDIRIQIKYILNLW